MLRPFLRILGILTVIFLLVPAGYSKTPSGNADENAKKTDDSASATVSGGDTPAETINADDAATADSRRASRLLPLPQDKSKDKKGTDDDYKPAPRFTPMLATTGTIGLFTLETADTLPKRAFNFSVYGNKFGRMPGSVTILEVGIDLSYGITDNLNVYASFDPYGHVHVGCPGQLSLRSIPLNTCAPLNFGFPPSNSFFPAFPGTTPGYVEDYPFASNNNGGIGDITLGLKYAFLSERHGAPVSFSVRNDLIISSKTDVNKLLNDGTEGSPLSDMVSLAVSKQWSNIAHRDRQLRLHVCARAARYARATFYFDMPDQVRTGAGLLFLPESRFQPMMEYSGVVFVTAPNTPPDNSFGARDPVDGVWGIRMYPWRHLGIDLGYRRMLNLRDLNDRNGFVVKVGVGLLAREGRAGQSSANGQLYRG